MSQPLPEWLGAGELAAVWDRIRERFEQTGLQASGTVRVVVGTRAQRHALGELLGRTVTRESVRIDLAALDARLHERSGLRGLPDVLGVLYGASLNDRPAARAARENARERPLALAGELITAPWAADWIAGLRRTGLLTGRSDAERVIRQASVVLADLTGGADHPPPRSRVEVGASLLGDAHALDRDRLLHQVVLRGLAAAAKRSAPTSARDRERLWAAYGIEPDLLSRTCLVWRLRCSGAQPVARRLELAADAGDPVHLTEWDLRRAGRFDTTSAVLVCENPRVVEAIAEQAPEGWAVVCTSGEPNLVAVGVLDRLVDSAATLHYHGDFDWPGVAIANRAVARYGVLPWRMSADDYLQAVRPDGPPLDGAPVEPSWDGELGAAMRTHRRAVHEEAVLATLLAPPPPRDCR